LKFAFRDPANAEKLVYQVRNAKLVSESLSSSLGDNKTVDLVFTSQIGAPQDSTNGVFVATAS